ncbi:acyl-CoA dehydrogenase family protein [Rhodospirillaceae bacterium AH-315-P19]|nr:acyl-CoA dehydrogenase family protein [Rhodospirillaceae bacterium AH-315-P19]
MGNLAADKTVPLPNLLECATAALGAADRLVESAKAAVTALVVKDGRTNGALLDRHQFAAHGFAWFATYVEALRQLLGWAERLEEEGKFSEGEALILEIAFAEYLAQMIGGIPMSQVEIVRPSDLGISQSAQMAFASEAAVTTLAFGNRGNAARLRLAELLKDSLETGNFCELGLADETLEMIREQFQRFSDEQIIPHAHEWHLKDELIPIEILQQMSELGVFGLTIPEEFGGLGLSKLTMCVVTEELSRGYIGVGSLGTRSEIAGELIRNHGTQSQKERFLPGIASGEILPTAVFTEPNIGSDLANLQTRAMGNPGFVPGDAVRRGSVFLYGARADLMTLLVRTNPEEKGYKGLSMFLAEKPRGTETDPFPAEGMSGGEIKVLGYRGMKEYEIAFDDFEVAAENLLGEKEGEGFKQLMATFESARVQTAARAVGVAQNAMELGLRYGLDRIQFGRPIYEFPRVAGKIASMAAEIMLARQLCYFAAREKDADRRCDVEAGMAKLLAARVAWAAADNALQIHGGNGYAQEYPISRVLCDARILNIFEGAGEIQAQVITRGLLAKRN